MAREDDVAPVDGEVDPAEALASLKLAASLVLALLVSARSLLAAFHGEMALADAAWQFLVAFVVARLGVGLVVGVWAGYRRQIDETEHAARVERLVREAEARAAAAAADRVAEEHIDTSGVPRDDRTMNGTL